MKKVICLLFISSLGWMFSPWNLSQGQIFENRVELSSKTVYTIGYVLDFTYVSPSITEMEARYNIENSIKKIAENLKEHIGLVVIYGDDWTSISLGYQFTLYMGHTDPQYLEQVMFDLAEGFARMFEEFYPGLIVSWITQN